jgi:hypothetical protein
MIKNKIILTAFLFLFITLQSQKAFAQLSAEETKHAKAIIRFFGSAVVQDGNVVEEAPTFHYDYTEGDDSVYLTGLANTFAVDITELHSRLSKNTDQYKYTVDTNGVVSNAKKFYFDNNALRDEGELPNELSVAKAEEAVKKFYERFGRIVERK